MNKCIISSFFINGLKSTILNNQKVCRTALMKNIKNIHDFKNIKVPNNILKETWHKDSFKDIFSIQETMQEPIKNLYPNKQRYNIKN